MNEPVYIYRELSPWYLALPLVCRQFGALIVAACMVTLWVLLLVFHVPWWVVLLTGIIPSIPLTLWLWYWTGRNEITVAEGNPDGHKIGY